MAEHAHGKRATHQEILSVARGSTKTHTHLRRRLAIILGATVVFAALCTLVIFFTEHNAKGTEIHNLFDAFLFATSQLLTGSSVAAPISKPNHPAGKGPSPSKSCVLASGANRTRRTALSCRPKTPRSFPACMSHNRTVLSLLPETRLCPSAEKWTESTSA